MIHKNISVKKLKLEQINYFKEYLTHFKENSKKYNLIKDGINELEKSI